MMFTHTSPSQACTSKDDRMTDSIPDACFIHFKYHEHLDIVWWVFEPDLDFDDSDTSQYPTLTFVYIPITR